MYTLFSMSRNIKFSLGEYYHIYNRGVEKRIIFNNEHDYQRFLLLLVLVNDEKSVEVQQLLRDYSIPELIAQKRKPLVNIVSFCLMPNHYHLILMETTEMGISKFMHKLGTGYTLYFNLKNDRNGSLFQGTYKAKHAEDDRYLKYLFEYIHLNPIREYLEKGGLVKNDLIKILVDNPNTSLRVYSGAEKGRLAEAVLDQKNFYTLFSSFNEHTKKLLQWSEK